jgi:SAM-dependent methyltransferase
MKEIEAWGVTYERYALGEELIKLKNQYSIQTVAEMPAHGAKAMPSIYSIGFGLAGANVTLINGFDTYRWCWKQLGLDDKVEFLAIDNIYNTNIPNNSFDLVWNFAYLPMEENHHKLLEEMKRISKKYVAFFSVNYGNIGFHIHRTIHKIKKVPWTHGDVYYNRRGNIVRFMKRHGLRIVKKGFVDCPIWPDSLGFRDMRLHRENIRFDNVDWESPYIANLASGKFPSWIKLVYAWEKIPNFSFIKTLYAHINYVIGEKPHG